jgi:RecA/RadA recombinase
MRSLAENQDVAGLHKMPTGIEGFDAVTGGGLPRNRTSLILGGPGGGKTVFALQTLVNGARQFGEEKARAFRATLDYIASPEFALRLDCK